MAVTAAQQAKDNGIIIISLAANVNENKAQLESVATSRRHVVIPQSLGDTSPVNYLVSMICEGKETFLPTSRAKLKYISYESNLDTKNSDSYFVSLRQ